VFSTYLYTGTNDGNPANENQTITNGIDLAGEGGLVWIKRRDTTGSNFFHDSERAATTRYLISNGTNAEANDNGSVTSFNSDGFTVGNWIENTANATYASWTFRKAPRFFDVVTFTGDGVNGRVLNHNLGVEPGMVVFKRTSSGTVAQGSWFTYHRGSGFGGGLALNSTDSVGYTFASPITAASDTTVTINNPANNGNINASGETYVAYLYAHDPLGPSGDGSDGLIACGSYTGNGSADGPVVNLGWEPQWLLIKESSASGNAWSLYDTMRNGTMDQHLRPNASDAEAIAAASPEVLPQATGFKLNTSSGRVNRSETYIYIAIRRGPMRAPTSGTEVFAPVADTGDKFITSGFPVDMVFAQPRSSGGNTTFDRIRGATSNLRTYSAAAEASASGGFETWFDYQNGIDYNWYGAGTNLAYHMFRRAPGCFDVVAYTGDGAYPTARAVPHNLGVAPELIIYKCRSASAEWEVHLNVSGTDYLRAYLSTNLSAAGSGSTLPYGAYAAAPDASNVYIRDAGANTVDGAGQTYIAYLFATLPGVSKVGSYTGNGTSQTIDCGFTTGARFILIKRTDSTGDWYVWDSARGIVAGNDPHLSLNATAAEVTTDDSVDAESSGFIVNQDAGTNVNVDTASYIFLAIA
jgi:hypothetical protein